MHMDVVLTIKQAAEGDAAHAGLQTYQTIPPGQGTRRTTHQTQEAAQQHEGQAHSIQWSQLVWRALAGLLSVAVLLLIALVALLLAAVWLSTGVHAVARYVLLRNGTLQPLKRHPRSLLQTAGLVYASWYAILLTHTWNALLRHTFQPAFVFFVYGEDEVCMSRTFSDVVYHALDLAQLPLPEVCPIGLIISRVGLGMCASMLPCLQHLDDKQTMRIPERVQLAFPRTRAIALAGRLPGVLAHLRAPPLQAPFVDGVHGTLFTMLAAAHALQEQVQRPLQDPSICVLGGSGFIGSRLVELLAQQGTASRGGAVHASAYAPAGEEQQHNDEQCQLGQRPLGLAQQWGAEYKLVISLDLRNTIRKLERGVLHTADPADISAANVVLVITAHGNDAAAYLPHARPGQVWGDDTHPEMGRRLVHALRSKGVRLYKVYSCSGVGAHFLPRLPGFPAHSIPGCLLMALTQAQGGMGVRTKPFDEFRAVAARLGFSAALGEHKPWFD